MLFNSCFCKQKIYCKHVA
ncbi:SWIM zinc finger family protein [Enterococcus faecium]|nr:hypothetical protein [Enterococcus faecium]EGP5067942.1 hypothetical protein [Enterococcus faecium]EME3496895.1 SWIM zinc finger family protein [Enterococcus faecium]EME7102033.1 SWIM zinc finger family protein [Enterococcus faecium]ROX94284.1 hypothetical protein EGW46_11540 [Enterococcus faecium]